MSVSAILSNGFWLAHRRPGAIMLDLVGKLIWLVIAAAIAIGVAAGIYWKIGSLGVREPAELLRNRAALMALARQIWTRYATTFLSTAVVSVVVLGITWMLLEAYFRAGA